MEKYIVLTQSFGKINTHTVLADTYIVERSLKTYRFLKQKKVKRRFLWMTFTETEWQLIMEVPIRMVVSIQKVEEHDKI
jgi:hypothetical protein